MTDYAPNWDQGQVLTASRRWHIANLSTAAWRIGSREVRQTLCGVYGYTPRT